MKRLVAICDILGFKKFVLRNKRDLKNITRRFEWIRRAAALALSEKTQINDTPALQELMQSKELGVSCFSDTFIFYTKNDTTNCCIKLINTVATLIFIGLRDPGTKIRAGIAYGDMEIDLDNSVYIGIPIIEAHETEQSQLWSGGALAPSAIERIADESRVYGEKPFGDWKLIRYQVPLKSTASITTDIAVDWTRNIHRSEILRWSQERSEPAVEDWLHNFESCEKWANTKKFHDSIGWCCNRNKR